MAGCWLRILMLFVSIAVTFVLFCIPHPGDRQSPMYYLEAVLPYAILAGLCVWFIWMSILGMRRLLRMGRRMHNPDLSDGAPCVISGKMQATGPHLEAPFSGERCNGYFYQVRRRSNSEWWRVYEGFALTPSVICSRIGDIPILAAPDKELFYPLKLKTFTVSDINDAVASRAKTYLDNTDFSPIVHGPGHFRVDEKVGRKNPPLERCRYEEKLAVEGEVYLLSGIYSTDPRGIKADPDTIFNPFHLMPGGVAALNKRLRNRWLGNLICLALVVALYFLSTSG
jgi:hypothetical protein